MAPRAPIITAVVVRLFAPDRGSCVLALCCGLPLVLLQGSILLFFFQRRHGSQSTYNYRRCSTFVCTGQRLVRARVVLLSTPGLASRKHFVICSSDTYIRGVFFLGYSILFFFQACFSSTRGNPGFYEANKHYFTPPPEDHKQKTKKTKH